MTHRNVTALKFRKRIARWLLPDGYRIVRWTVRRAPAYAPDISAIEHEIADWNREALSLIADREVTKKFDASEIEGPGAHEPHGHYKSLLDHSEDES